MNHSIEPHAKNNADAAAGKSKYKMPVSRAFYKKITEKGRKIIVSLKLDEFSAAILQKYIDDYINNDTLPECPAAPDAPYIVFSVLRLEIDEAIKRSSAARRRAAERRESKERDSKTLDASPKPEPASEEAAACPPVENKKRWPIKYEKDGMIYVEYKNTCFSYPKDSYY